MAKSKQPTPAAPEPAAAPTPAAPAPLDPRTLGQVPEVVQIVRLLEVLLDHVPVEAIPRTLWDFKAGERCDFRSELAAALKDIGLKATWRDAPPNRCVPQLITQLADQQPPAPGASPCPSPQP